jgi:hypothetical protein
MKYLKIFANSGASFCGFVTFCLTLLKYVLGGWCQLIYQEPDLYILFTQRRKGFVLLGHVPSFFSDFYVLEDEGATCMRSTGNKLSSDTVSYPKGTDSWTTDVKTSNLTSNYTYFWFACQDIVKNIMTKPGRGGECMETHLYLCNSITVTHADFISYEMLHSVDLWLLTDALG